MLRTVILNPYLKQVSGTLEQITDINCIHLKLNLNYTDCTQDDIIRLYALSTAHAAMTPYLVHSFGSDFKSPIESTIYESDIFSLGYKLFEIDTYVITKYNPGCEIAVAAAFFGLEWSASRFLKAKEQNEDADINSPLKRAKQILDDRKSTAQNGEPDFYANEIIQNLSNHPQMAIKGIDNYNWYKINRDVQVSSLSGVRHALSNKYAIMAMNDCGYYAVGILKTNPHHIALAITASRNICPMPQLADCVSYVDGFHIAGIFLGEDGQYFEKYLQNTKL